MTKEWQKSYHQWWNRSKTAYYARLEKYTLQFEKLGSVKAEDMTELGKFVREIIEKNPENFRIFGPDETKSNRLNQVFKTTNRQWMEKSNQK